MVTVQIDNTAVIDPAQQADIDKFERMLVRYKAGEIPEDVMRVFRLNNGIYGQRQGGTNQMVRIKIPAGIAHPEHFEALAHIARTYSRGWGHITTRQNIQFHYVELEDVPDVMRILASVGLTTREACGDTVRNVQGCHLAGACPHEVLDITAWARATALHFLRHPYAQRLPRKFKINFSGCATDCGQAMFNDVGIIAATREVDGGVEAGFRVFVAGGLGANPHPALALEDFTSREDLLPTIEACLRVFDHDGYRDNKLRARMKWLVEKLGFEELQRRIFRERKFLLASSSWPGGIPDLVKIHGDAPAGRHAEVEVTPVGQGVAVSIGGRAPYERWEQANVVRGAAKGTVSAYAWARLGDITADQFDSLADIQRELGAECRITNRQNIVFRDLGEHQLPRLFEALSTIGMAEPGAELLRDVVAWPRRRHLQPGGHPVSGPGRRHWQPLGRRGPRRGGRFADQHLGLHQLVWSAPRLRHRLLRCRATSTRPVGTGLPDAARGLCGRLPDPLRHQGPAPTSPQRPRSGGTGGAPVHRRAGGRRRVPPLARAQGRIEGGRQDADRLGRVPRARRRPRILRRLRRDRPLRSGDRRL